jgi:hypothetical protein
MFDNSYTLDFSDTDSLVLTRINQDDFASTYYGTDTDGSEVTLEIKHNRVVGQQSHIVKLAVVSYDEDGAPIRTTSPWINVKTFKAKQDAALAAQATGTLLEFIQMSGHLDRLLAFES